MTPELDEALRVARRHVEELRKTLREREETLARARVRCARFSRSLRAAQSAVDQHQQVLDPWEVSEAPSAIDPDKPSLRQAARDEVSCGAVLVITALLCLAAGWFWWPRFFMYGCIALVAGANLLWSGGRQLLD